MTRFATVWPGEKLRLETDGTAIPSGNTVRNPEADGSTAVTLSTTAAVPAGTGAVPTLVTCTFSVELADKAFPAFGSPEPARVSVMRKGVTDTYEPISAVAAWGVIVAEAAIASGPRSMPKTAIKAVPSRTGMCL